MASFDSTNSAPSSSIQTYDEDPVENMIKKTGCMDFHYKVQVEIVINVILFWVDAVATEPSRWLRNSAVRYCSITELAPLLDEDDSAAI